MLLIVVRIIMLNSNLNQGNFHGMILSVCFDRIGLIIFSLAQNVNRENNLCTMACSIDYTTKMGMQKWVQTLEDVNKMAIHFKYSLNTGNKIFIHKSIIK